MIAVRSLSAWWPLGGGDRLLHGDFYPTIEAEKAPLSRAAWRGSEAASAAAFDRICAERRFVARGAAATF
ncbi:MAG: hypothetical protein IT536_11925 [Hyphomicrobiales bacterium]|nr:hypothetical protein [Hyphomicrobiales bacterium]